MLFKAGGEWANSLNFKATAFKSWLCYFDETVSESLRVIIIDYAIIVFYLSVPIGECAERDFERKKEEANVRLPLPIALKVYLALMGRR